MTKRCVLRTKVKMKKIEKQELDEDRADVQIANSRLADPDDKIISFEDLVHAVQPSNPTDDYVFNTPYIGAMKSVNKWFTCIVSNKPDNEIACEQVCVASYEDVEDAVGRRYNNTCDFEIIAVFDGQLKPIAGTVCVY